MKIRSIKKISVPETFVYDVINVPKYHNFLIKSNTTNNYIVSHNCGIMDEVSFSKGADVQMEKSKIMKTYSSVLERITATFIVQGKVHGKLFLVSSKKSEYDFLESYIRKQKGKPGICIIDALLWEVKPFGTYSGKKFKLAVGSSNMPSKILDKEDNPDDYQRMGYEILDVPIELKGRFELDMNGALMNLAGISVSNVTKFITYDALEKCFIQAENPFTDIVLSIGLRDNLRIRDYFKPQIVDKSLTAYPLFIHIDTSLTGDKTGIGCVALMGFVYKSRYQAESGEFEPTKELVFRHIFSVEIEAPRGSEISFQKTREFIYYLKNELFWNIKGISLDGFQSADSKQQFILMGFENTTIVSLDKKPDGYLAYRSAVNERRIQQLNIPFINDEVIGLEQNNLTGKIDHSPLGVDRKDGSDGLAGAVYNASLNASKLNLTQIETLQTILDINQEQSEMDEKQGLLNNLVNKSINPEYNSIIEDVEQKIEDAKNGINIHPNNDILEKIQLNNDYDDGFIVW